MSRFTFDPNPRVIRLPAFVAGPARGRSARAILDCGAAWVILRSEVAEYLGFRLDRAHEISVVTGSGEVRAREVKLGEVWAVYQSVLDVPAVALDLPPDLKADVLLGNTFLRHFTVTFDLAEGYLDLRPRGAQSE